MNRIEFIKMLKEDIKKSKEQKMLKKIEESDLINDEIMTELRKHSPTQMEIIAIRQEYAHMLNDGIMTEPQEHEPKLVEKITNELESFQTLAANFINEMFLKLNPPPIPVFRGDSTQSENTIDDDMKSSEESVKDLFNFMHENNYFWFPAYIDREKNRLDVRLYCRDQNCSPDLLPEINISSNLEKLKIKEIESIDNKILQVIIESDKKLPKLDKISLHVNQETSHATKIELVINKTIKN